MIKTTKGAAIGSLVGGGLGFAVVTAVYSHWDYGYVSEYPWMGGVIYGVPPECFIGLVIGAVIGTVVGWCEKK